MSWTFIRIFGEMKLLTRVSYAALLLVPVLAALWPAIQVFANSASDVLDAQRVALEAVASRFEAISATEVPEALRKEALTLAESIRTSAEPSGQIGALPAVWVAAFFGALSVVIGHAIYEAACPEIVKKQSRQDFSDTQLRRYRDSQSQVNLKDSAIFLLQHSDIEVLRIIFGDRSLKEEVYESLEKSAKKYYFSESNKTDFDKLFEENSLIFKKHDREIILKSSEMYYAHAEEKGKWGLACKLLAFVLYLIALVLVFIMTANQAVSVIDAAGMHVPALLREFGQVPSFIEATSPS